MAVQPTEEDVMSRYDEFLRAAEALKKVVNLSDEEWMETAIHLEEMQIEGEEEDEHQGAQQEDVRQVQDHSAHPHHPHQEVCDQEEDGHQGAQYEGVLQEQEHQDH